MKTKKMKKAILNLAIGVSLTSCVSYNHSYRLSDDTSKEKRSFEVKENYLVDLDIDFSSRIKASSSFKHRGVGQIQRAKEDAYYQAITQSNIDVLVNPIYQVKTVKSIFGTKSTADVVGFKGMYGKITEVEGGGDSSESSSALSQEDELFEMRFENLKKLSSINDIAHEEKSVYAIDSRQGCCEGNTTKGSDGFGNLHLLETTKNKQSLVKQYMRIVGVEVEEDEQPVSLGNKRSLFNFKF